MLLDNNIFVFLIPFLAMFFLFGELFVKLKGIGAILGLGFIGYYFSFFLDSGQLVWMGIVFLVGIGLIILDGKVVNDGTLGVLGLILVLLIIGFTAPSWVEAIYSTGGVLLGILSSLFLLKVFPKRKMWSKVALMDQLSGEAGYNTLTEEYRELLGKSGVTQTVLRPTGTIRVKDSLYSAVSDGKWIEQGREITIVKVEGTRIVVKENDEE